jgi:hypothetical protein
MSGTKMVLDNGGTFDLEGKYIPGMSRLDLQEFLFECAKAGITRDFAEEFLLQLFNMSTYLKEPPAPKLEDDLYKVWAIDDDIEELINPILTRRNLQRINWNDSPVLELGTIGDAILFCYRKTYRKKIYG